MRAAGPPASGREAKSTKLTDIAPSAWGIGDGNGLLLVWANPPDTITSEATATRVIGKDTMHTVPRQLHLNQCP